MALAATAQKANASPAVLRTPRFYRPELDVLRLGAFLMVWTAHALLSFSGFLPQRWLAIGEEAGSCGVPIFFFLSAYLITELLRRERLLTGEIHLRFFYVRRILRIWPLYFGVLAAYGFLGLRFHGFRIETGRLAASSLLVGNWYIAMHPAITTPMRALWSISVEEQWYVLWPLLRRVFSTRALLAACGIIVAFAYCVLAGLALFSTAPSLNIRVWVNSGVQFQYMGLGAAAALLLDGRIPQIGGWRRCFLGCGAAAAILLAAGACRFKESGPHSAASLCTGYALIALGTFGCFFAVLGLSPRLCPRPLVRLGQLSFGLYVFHETAFFLAGSFARKFGVRTSFHSIVTEKLFALAFTAVLATASYYAWELPFLRLKQRWTFVRSREAQ